MIAYRLHDANRLDDMLNPEMQFSFSVRGYDEDVRRGVSACGSLSQLAAYYATSGLVIANPTLVEVEGPESEDIALDASEGEVLVHPTRYQVLDTDAFFDLVSDLVDLMWADGLGFDELEEIADERLAN